MFCDACGNQLVDGAKFCPGCGAVAPRSAGDPQPVAGRNRGSSERETPTVRQGLKSQVVRALEGITILAFLVLVSVCSIGGWFVGRLVSPSDTAQLAGAFIGLGVGLLVAVLATGLIFVQLSIEETLVQIRELLRDRNR